jgi:hypothetical protein
VANPQQYRHFGELCSIVVPRVSPMLVLESLAADLKDLCSECTGRGFIETRRLRRKQTGRASPRSNSEDVVRKRRSWIHAQARMTRCEWTISKTAGFYDFCRRIIPHRGGCAPGWPHFTRSVLRSAGAPDSCRRGAPAERVQFTGGHISCSEARKPTLQVSRAARIIGNGYACPVREPNNGHHLSVVLC